MTEDLTVQHALDAIGKEGSRTASAYEFYMLAPGERRMQHLVITWLAEEGYTRGASAWSRTIQRDAFEAGLEAMQGAVTLLTELELEKKGGG